MLLLLCLATIPVGILTNVEYMYVLWSESMNSSEIVYCSGNISIND